MLDEKCPQCGQQEEFRVLVSAVVFRVSEHETCVDGNVDWDDESNAHCPRCGWSGKWSDVRPKLATFKLLSTVPTEELIEALVEIRDCLWPNGDLDHQWDSETMDQVARVFTNRKFVRL